MGIEVIENKPMVSTEGLTGMRMNYAPQRVSVLLGRSHAGCGAARGRAMGSARRQLMEQRL